MEGHDRRGGGRGLSALGIPVSVVLPLAVALVVGASAVANEWSHGAVAEAAGFGHHHMLDAGDDHACGAHHANGTHAPDPCAHHADGGHHHG